MGPTTSKKNKHPVLKQILGKQRHKFPLPGQHHTCVNKVRDEPDLPLRQKARIILDFLGRSFQTNLGND